jgi:hypothetical protein
MLVSELTDWSEGVVVEEKQSVLQRTTAFLNDREVRKEELRSLRYAVVSLKLKAQGILNFASLKRNRSTGEAPIVTKNDDGLATLLRAYPIASSICQHLTTKDLRNLAAAVPSVMWADTKKVLADPQPPLLRMHPDIAIVFPAQLRNMYEACRARVGTFIPYPRSQRALKAEVLVDFFTRIIPEFKARLEELEHRKIRTCSLDRIEPNITAYRRAHRRSEKVLRLYNDYRRELGKMAETADVIIPACFGLYKAPGKMTLWEPSVSDNRRQNIPARPRSASLPDRRKPDISTFLFDPEPDLATSNIPSKECTPLRDFRVQKRIMTDQLNHRRLQDLLVGLHGTDTVAPQIYHLQDLLQLSTRRYDSQCKCIAEGAQVCFYHGLRLSAKPEQMDFWTRFWFEVPHSAVMNPEKPFVKVSEDELESLIDAYPGWDYLDRQRVEEIVSARIDAKRNGIRPLWNPGCADSLPYWESLQYQTSECACCGLSKPKLDAKFEKIWEILGNARRGVVRAHPAIQDMAALMLAEYLGTTECWGCDKMFCNVRFVLIFTHDGSNLRMLTSNIDVYDQGLCEKRLMD